MKEINFNGRHYRIEGDKVWTFLGRADVHRDINGASAGAIGSVADQQSATPLFGENRARRERRDAADSIS